MQTREPMLAMRRVSTLLPSMRASKKPIKSAQRVARAGPTRTAANIGARKTGMK